MKSLPPSFWIIFILIVACHVYMAVVIDWWVALISPSVFATAFGFALLLETVDRKWASKSRW